MVSAYSLSYPISTNSRLHADVTAYSHDPLGDVTSLTDPDGNTTSWTYDHLGQVTSQSSLVALGYFPDGSVQTTLATSYDFHDAAGNLTDTIDSDGRSISRVYDNLNRETGETWRDASAAQTGTVADAYNAASANSKAAWRIPSGRMPRRSPRTRIGTTWPTGR